MTILRCEERYTCLTQTFAHKDIVNAHWSKFILVMLLVIHITITNTHPEPLKVEAGATLDPAHDIKEIWGEDKGDSFSVHPQEAFCVAQDVAEINMEKIP